MQIGLRQVDGFCKRAVPIQDSQDTAIRTMGRITEFANITFQTGTIDFADDPFTLEFGINQWWYPDTTEQEIIEALIATNHFYLESLRDEDFPNLESPTPLPTRLSFSVRMIKAEMFFQPFSMDCAYLYLLVFQPCCLR